MEGTDQVVAQPECCRENEDLLPFVLSLGGYVIPIRNQFSHIFSRLRLLSAATAVGVRPRRFPDVGDENYFEVADNSLQENQYHHTSCKLAT